MKNIHLEGINDVRIGKHIQMTIDAESKDAATEKVETACKKLLSNMIMEGYTYEISPVE